MNAQKTFFIGGAGEGAVKKANYSPEVCLPRRSRPNPHYLNSIFLTF